MFRFSRVFKNEDINLITDFQIKLKDKYCYNSFKVALMEPNLENKACNEIIHFRINEYHPNNTWISLGMCHKHFMARNSYNININNFFTLGHGAYLISSNGFCFSNTDENLNNEEKVQSWLCRASPSTKETLSRFQSTWARRRWSTGRRPKYLK
jgi:hypothetical protein